MCTLKSSFLVACHFPFCSTNTKCSLFSSRLEARGNFSQSYSGSASLGPLVRWFKYGILIFDICHIRYKSIYIYMIYHMWLWWIMIISIFFVGVFFTPNNHEGIMGGSRMTIPVPKLKLSHKFIEAKRSNSSAIWSSVLAMWCPRSIAKLVNITLISRLDLW